MQHFEQARTTGNKLVNIYREQGKLDTNLANLLYYMSYTCHQLEDYPKAVEYAEQDAEVRLRIQGGSSSAYVTARYNLGAMHAWDGNTVQAIANMRFALDYMETTYGRYNPQTMSVGFELGKVLLNAGSTRAANDLYNDYWSYVQEHYQPEDEYYMQVSNHVAPFFIQSGEYSLAEPFYVNATEQMKRTYGDESREYEMTLKSKVEFYEYIGWYHKLLYAQKEQLELIARQVGKESHVYTQKKNDWLSTYNLTGEYYLNQGDFEQSYQVFKGYLKEAEDAFGKKSEEYATALNNLGVACEKTERNEEGLQVYDEALKLKEKLSGKDTPFYALTLSNKAVLLENLGRSQEAKELMQQCLHIYEKEYGPEHPDYATALSNLASNYSSTGEYEKAYELLIAGHNRIKDKESITWCTVTNNLALVSELKGDVPLAHSFYSELIPVAEAVLGVDHPEYATILYNGANVLSSLGRYAEAEALLNMALQSADKSVGKDHTTYTRIQLSLAGVYQSLGLRNEADVLYRSSGEIFERVYGTMHPEYATFLSNYGLFLSETGHWEEAIEKFQNAIQIVEDAYGPEHPDLRYALTNLANTFMEKRQYAAAESYLVRAQEIAESALGKDHPDVASGLNNLATLYFRLGNYERSLEYHERSLVQRKAIWGNEHPEVAISYNNMGSLYLEWEEADDRLNKALDAFNECLRLDSSLQLLSHPDHSMHLNNLAETYRQMNRPEEARKLYERSIALEEQYYGKRHPNIAVSYHNLAMVFTGLQDYALAQENASKALAIYQDAYGNECSECTSVFFSLGQIHFLQGHHYEAIDHYRKGLFASRKFLNDNFEFLSSAERTHLLNSLRYNHELFLDFAIAASDSIPEALDIAMENQAFERGLLLRTDVSIRNKVKNGGKELRIKYEEWLSAKQRIAKLYAEVEPQEGRIEALETKITSLEKEMASMAFEPQRDRNIPTIREMKKALGEEDAMVDFFAFQSTLKDGTPYTQYGAFVLKKELDHPLLVPLCHLSDLEAVLGQHPSTYKNYIDELYGTQNSFDADLYRLVWQPLDSVLQNTRSVYLYPTELFHKIAFHALRKENGIFLSKEYELHIRHSLPDESDGELPLDKKDQVCVIGGAEFSAYGEDGGIWDYLPGTLKEAEQVEAIFDKSNASVVSLKGFDAREENIKSLQGKVIHMASHGFFFPDPAAVSIDAWTEQEESVAFRGGGRGADRFVTNPNPMMRSGIALTGANDSWKDPANEEDGILTAYEVSLMDLSGTELVVLSACETGLGEIHNSEGIYGLQRAFRIAGVKSQIISLWQVPDEETAEFMTLFYEQLLKTENVRASFSSAREKMRSKYDPYYWAAFVLTQ